MSVKAGKKVMITIDGQEREISDGSSDDGGYRLDEFRSKSTLCHHSSNAKNS